MTRVLHLTRDHPPHHKGGLSLAVDWLADTAAAAGHPQLVVSFDRWRPRADPGALAAPPPERPAPGLRVVRVRAPDHVAALRPEIAAFAPALLAVHDPLLWPAADTLAADLATQPKQWLWVHVRHAELNRLRQVPHTASAAAQERALAAADCAVVAGPAGAAGLGADHPGVVGRTRVLPLSLRGLTVAAARSTQLPATTQPSQLSQLNPQNRPVSERQRERGPPRVVVVGRLDVSKGTADLIAALPNLLRAAPSAEVWFVGGVPGNPSAERRWRRQLAGVCPEAATRVHVTGWLTPQAAAQHLRAASVALFASHAETQGLALLQALAAGVPVVATDVPGHRDLVGDGHALGVTWVASARPTALAAAAAAALDHPAPLRAAGALARRDRASAVDAAATRAWLTALSELEGR